MEHYTRLMSEGRDRQLLKAIVFGVMRNLSYLDFILTKFCRHSLAKMQPIVLQSLRSGLYQLLFMNRLPEAAIINETIKALKAQHQPKWLTGFVNGVLRNICRQRGAILAMGSDLPLTARYNHPEWLLQRWLTTYGRQETADICSRNNQPAPLCLRINRGRTCRADFLDLLHRHGYNARAGLMPESIWLEGAGAVAKIPGFAKGLFSVQDETAQIITGMLAPLTAGNYLDACAGLGGKTMAMAQMVPAGGTIWAVEPHKGRQNLLGDNLARLGLREVNCFAGNLADFVRTTPLKFQAILVDAPCSGLGVIGRHPEIRWNRRSDDLAYFQKIQVALLENVAQILAPNGIIVYSTCSMEPEENEEVLKIFLANKPQIVISGAQQWLPEQARSYVNQEGLFHTRPSEDTQDGFFAARLVHVSRPEI